MQLRRCFAALLCSARSGQRIDSSLKETPISIDQRETRDFRAPLQPPANISETPTREYSLRLLPLFCANQVDPVGEGVPGHGGPAHRHRALLPEPEGYRRRDRTERRPRRAPLWQCSQAAWRSFQVEGSIAKMLHIAAMSNLMDTHKNDGALSDQYS